MNRLRVALEILFQRQNSESEDADSAWERMGRELQGSIFTLIGLFELVALTSYLPLDTVSLYQGRFDHMVNLGGIVGAGLAEFCLGSVGIMGYSIILLTSWLAIASFRGVPLRQNLYRVFGTIVTSCLAAIGLHLIFADQTPEASLLNGGWIGKHAGIFLQTYFNTTGALLLVGGGFAFTLILTTGFSVVRTYLALFGNTETEDEDEDEEEDARPVRRAAQVADAPAEKAATPAPAAAAPAPAKPKRSRKKKTDDSTPADLAAVNENGEDGQPPQVDENGEPLPAPSGEFKFEELIPFEGPYTIPSLRLLKSPSGQPRRMSKGEARATAQKLVEHLLSFQITGEVVAVSQGPVLTTYEFKPSAGIKLSKIAALQDDLGVVLGTNELRIVAPIPGKTVVGIEVPRPQSEVIALKDCLADDGFNDKKVKLPFALGKTTDGEAVFGDIAAMPHLLVAGATGSGKSVFVNSLIMSFLFRMTPQQLRLILVDPKMLELNVFDGLPHLITNVITDHGVAYNALSWAVMEMERRYQLMAETNSKNIESYNSKQKNATAKLPFIVIVVDELADLMLSGGEAVEIAITRLAQKARAAGLHLVIATQRPSTDVITGLIKANIPSRISFKVPSGIDSRTILDTGGAENLIGRGDSLMIQPAVPIRRLHGSFVTEEELIRTVKFIKGSKDHTKTYINFGGAPPDEKKKKK